MRDNEREHILSNSLFVKELQPHSGLLIRFSLKSHTCASDSAWGFILRWSHLCAMLKAPHDQSPKSIHHPWFAHEGTETAAGCLPVKWGVHTFDQIPRQAAPGAPIGSCTSRSFRHDLSLDRPRPPGMWPFELCAGRCDCLVQGVMEDFGGQNTWPLPFNPQGSGSQQQGL